MSETIKIWDTCGTVDAEVHLFTLKCGADKAISLALLAGYYGHVFGLVDSEGRPASFRSGSFRGGYLYPPNGKCWGKKVYFLNRGNIFTKE